MNLTGEIFGALMDALKVNRSTPRSGAFFVPGWIAEAANQNKSRVNRWKYNTLRGNTTSAVYCVVEARHLVRGILTTTESKQMNIEEKHPGLELEKAVMENNALLFLMADKLAQVVEEYWSEPQGGNIAAGILALSHNARETLATSWAMNHEATRTR